MKQKENYNGFKKTIKFIANIISWTVLVILLLIAAFLAYYFIANNIYANKGKKYEPPVGLYTIVSPSMTPNLKVYDVIVDFKVKKPEDIKVGDIITFISTSSISKGLTITHRVVALVETENGIEYKTQGDNNLTPDTTTVPFKNVLGKVFLRIPQLGRIQYFLSSSSGWLLIVVIPALMIILTDIVKIIRLSKAKKKVTHALNTEEILDQKEQERKEEIADKLKHRYNIERRELEKDPLETNKELKEISGLGKKQDNKEIYLEEKLIIPEKVEETVTEEQEEIPFIPIIEKKPVAFELPKLKTDAETKNETIKKGKKKKKKRN